MKYPLLFVLMILLFPLPSLAQRKLPVDNGRITSEIGWRPDPFGSGRMVYHRGVDIAAPTGTPVYSMYNGVVYYAGPYKGYGNLVAVDHGNGYLTLYGHNSALKVSRGQRVDDTTVIALAGSTGRSTGPHVHYEIRRIAPPDKKRIAQLKKELRSVVESDIHEWVEGIVSGDGQVHETEYLPSDIDE
ncbi:MAG: M23 family metallopeptidase [Geobacteraceae bacterium]|nr:M23 family metallopeptidase [Geobacteraceae bacterium]